jgi:hypothetical protein
MNGPSRTPVHVFLRCTMESAVPDLDAEVAPTTTELVASIDRCDFWRTA